MNYKGNQYRVVDENDRHTTVRTFDTLEKAQNFSRGGRYEIQRAVEAADGTIFEWERTALSQSRLRRGGAIA